MSAEGLRYLRGKEELWALGVVEEWKKKKKKKEG
jgi:hypothetical protein